MPDGTLFDSGEMYVSDEPSSTADFLLVHCQTQDIQIARNDLDCRVASRHGNSRMTLGTARVSVYTRARLERVRCETPNSGGNRS